MKRIVVEGISKSYSDRIVLRNVSLDMGQGEVVGLLGPNGAGKTTCFYCIMGLIQPDRGRITLGSEDIAALPFYRRAQKGIGYLPQESSIFRTLSVEDNIMAVLEVVMGNRDRRQQRLEELLAEFSISHLRHSPSVALSGGERRRLEIARALAAKPDFILLDEPFAGVDPIAVVEIRNLVSHLRERGYGVLITDHNVRETLEITDRAYVLHDGSILAEGKPSELVSDQKVRRHYLGEGFRM
jgi:lipopolysaccharide export system ATP-binding protein